MAKKKEQPSVDGSGMSKIQVQDSLASVIATSLNQAFKQYDKVAYFLDGSEESPSDLTDWVSTGSTELDLALSNRPNGGYPVGRIIEIVGWEAAGKSLLASHALAETQKQNGLPVYIDTENALNVDFLEAIGVDVSKEKFLYVQLETVEEIFSAIEDIITKVRTSDKKRLVTIVVDSVAGASTKAEIEGDYDKDGWATGKAIIISKAMRKITNLIGKERILLIFTNQLRTKLGVSFGDASTTSGGKALAFHCSGRLQAAQIGKIKAKINGVEQVVGIRTRVKVIKTRMGPPHRQAEFNIYFDKGIDDLSGWVEQMKKYSLVTKSGNSYIYVDKETGEEIKFLEKNFPKLVTDRPELREAIYKELCDMLIMKYRKKTDATVSYDENDVTVDDKDVDTE